MMMLRNTCWSWAASAVIEPVLSHWRSTSGFEVDFVIGDHTAIEAKAKPSISANDLKSLRALGEERRLQRLVCVTMERARREVGGIALLPWRDFLAALWDGSVKSLYINGVIVAMNASPEPIVFDTHT